MNMESDSDKAAWRRRFRTALKGIPPALRDEASARALDLLRRQPLWQRARTILFYAPMSEELDVTPLLEESLRAGKAAALPRFNSQTGNYEAFEVRDTGNDCAPGKFGIIEPRAHCPPMPLKRLDLALVPGLGFDLSGRRLGRGKGFYDRLLAGMTGTKCGIAFDEQVAGRIPAEEHDVMMNYILTPTRWLEAAKPIALSL